MIKEDLKELSYIIDKCVSVRKLAQEVFDEISGSDLLEFGVKEDHITSFTLGYYYKEKEIENKT